jgi:hypothetical protein
MANANAGSQVVMPSLEDDRSQCPPARSVAPIEARASGGLRRLSRVLRMSGPEAQISCSSTRSVGARMNTSHIRSGSCWLPLMKPITSLPVASSMTLANRLRMTS